MLRAEPGTALTPSELAVLDAVARGLQTKQIARSMHLSENTVKSHLQRASLKLGATTRAQAVYELMRLRCGHCPADLKVPVP